MHTLFDSGKCLFTTLTPPTIKEFQKGINFFMTD